MPLVVKISRMGVVSVGKDTKLDTGSDEEDDDNTNEQQKPHPMRMRSNAYVN